MSATRKPQAQQTTLSNVLKQVQPDGSVQAKTPKDKASPATAALETLQTICDEPQLIAVATFWDNAKALHAEQQAKTARFDALVLEIHPTGTVAYEVYRAIVSYFDTRDTTGVGDYAAKCYRMAVRRLPAMGCTRDAAGKIDKLGELPTKGRGKGGIKGQSALKWYKGVARGLKTMTERVRKAPSKLIDAKVLAAWLEAYSAMVKADKVLYRAIANDAKAGKATKAKAKVAK